MAKANLSSMLAQLKEEDKIVVETVDELNLNDVQKAWDKYAASVERDSLRFQLQGVELSLQQMTINAKVSSILVESAIREEHDLTETLRRQLKAPDLMLKVEVDASMRKEEVKVKPKTLNAREKYQMMVEQNPAVKDLVKRFGLRPDE